MKLKSCFNFSAKCLILTLLVSCSVTNRRSIKVIETTDIHGVILPYDYIEKQKLKVSMASAYTYIDEVRKSDQTVFLLDDGDNLQGQPEVYYYNFIDTVTPHLLARVMNYMKYDATTVGNHDIETGHLVYDRLRREYKFPMLAANAVDTRSGKPYFKPYIIVERSGIKIAVFGMVTPEIPNWLPSELYSGIEFKDMVETAKLWMPEIKKEKPDLIIGLFHSGWTKDEEASHKFKYLGEDESTAVAYQVPGFNIIFTGHDHKAFNSKFVNSAGDSVLILNAGSHSEKIAEATITNIEKSGNKKQFRISGRLINASDFKPDQGFISEFTSDHNTVEEYVSKVIGDCSSTISSRDAYFGPSAFMSLIHKIQLKVSGADISFAAPLSFDVQIEEGPITVSDLFKLYKYENMLYTMSLSGAEIKKYLEYSYEQWINTMSTSSDLLLKFKTGQDGKPVLTNQKAWLKNPPYNFDSAEGIEYSVDVSKPAGERILIKSLSDGRPFEENKYYKVAVNSYRGNGGGGHLTEGAGIPKDELRKRLISSTDRDLRYYMLKYMEEKKAIDPVKNNNWKFIPDRFIQSAIPSEYNLLFGDNKKSKQNRH